MKMVDTKKRTAQVSSASGVRVNKTGRRSFTLEYKLGVVRECSEPGVSVAAIALRNRLNANLVRRWIVGHQRALLDSNVKPQSAMLPVTIEAATSTAPMQPADDADAATKRKRAAPPNIEIEVYGARIHLRGGVDAETLRSVLDVLAQR
jgi:transposase